MHVVSIGNFDGVHEGHRALLRKARKLSEAGGGPARLTAVTFEPSPTAILRPEKPLQRLDTPDDRGSWLLEAGADEVVELDTDMALLGMDAEEFIEDLLDRLGARLPVGGFVEGPDFRFGRGRKGSVETLSDHGGRSGFQLEVVPVCEVRLGDGFMVQARSSTIRRLLALGRVEDAARVLGRPYQPVGTVVSGDRRGREIGFPTANLDLGSQILPADGVYAGAAILPDGRKVPAAVSIGVKPTFQPTPRLMEVHLLDWDGELDEYEWELRVSLLKRLRGQCPYDGVEPLIEQIRRDCDATRACFNRDTSDDVEIA